jgi:hypothetical protein
MTIVPALVHYAPAIAGTPIIPDRMPLDRVGVSVDAIAQFTQRHSGVIVRTLQRGGDYNMSHVGPMILVLLLAVIGTLLLLRRTGVNMSMIDARALVACVCVVSEQWPTHLKIVCAGDCCAVHVGPYVEFDTTALVYRLRCANTENGEKYK